jgi:glycerol-3-phosphate acyltransferase PlsY
MHKILFILFSYLLGSIPFGFIIYYLTEKKDIRSQGSGNIGATNVLRSKGKAAGLVTLMLDMLKGAIPVLVGLHYFDYPVVVLLGGAAAVLGHMFPLFLKFRGGKGVATLAGMVLAFSLPAFIVFAVVFLLTLAATKYVSAGSLAGVTALFFFTLFTRVMEISMIVFLLLVIIILKHSSNLKRIISGTENKLRLTKNG